eukprot:gene1698-467_t
MGKIYESSVEEKSIRSQFNSGDFNQLPLRKLNNFTIFNLKTKKPISIEKLNNCFVTGKIQNTKKKETILIESERITEKKIDFKNRKILLLTENSVYELLEPSIAYLHFFRPNFFEILFDLWKILKQKPKSSLADLYASSLGEESMEIITTFYKFYQYELCLDEFKETDLVIFDEIEEIKKQKQKIDIHEDTIQQLNKKVNLEIKKTEQGNIDYFGKFWNVVEPFVSSNSHSQQHKNLIENMQKVYETQQNGTNDSNSEIHEEFKQPSYINGTMRDYQLKGLKWLISLYDKNVSGCILGVKWKSRSVLSEWKNEFNKWSPKLNILKYHGNEYERTIQREKIKKENVDVILTNYERFNSDFTFLRRISFNVLVVDEAHKIKNPSTIISSTVKSLNAKFKLMLTGTPLQNNLTELWTLLNSMYPSIFISSEVFDESFDLRKKVINKEILSKVHKLLEPIMLRRIKKEVELDIPNKKETKIYLPLTKIQIELYQQILTQASGSMIDGKKVELKYLLMLLMQLRKLCQHPLLFFNNDEVQNPDSIDIDIITASSKMIFLDKLLKKLKKNGSKVLIYSQFTTMLDILEDYCDQSELKYCRLDGRAEQKQYLNSMVISKYEQEHQKSEKLDIISTLSFGAEKIYKSKGTDISEQDVDKILEESEKYDKEDKKEHNVDEYEIKEENPLRLFMGKLHEKVDPKVEEEKNLGTKRKRVNRITYVGKNPVLTIDNEEPPKVTKVDQTKKKKKIENETCCFVCSQHTKEDVHACSRCPKVYHRSCLGDILLGHLSQFICPWHFCRDCNKSSTEAGGIMFRCDNCPKSFCKECFDKKDYHSMKILDRSSKMEYIGYKSDAGIYLICEDCNQK